MEKIAREIRQAAERLKGHAHVTPVMTCSTLDQTVGAEVFFKCENFQRMGAFKFRGAFNAMSQLSAKQKAKGVLTYSSGNHAQAVALVGRLLGIRTTVVMPDNAPAIKRSATEGYGARVIGYDPGTTSREAIVQGMMDREDHTLILPFDQEEIIAGQGTAALELFRTTGPMDMLLVPCGGGGLLSGSAVAAKSEHPACKVIGVEPELADDATRSFETGILQTVHNSPTIADGTRTPSLGRITFPLILEHVDRMRTVSEQAIMDAVRFLFHRMKIVVEPSGALGLAALMSGAVQAQGRVGVILSGGNVDASTMVRVLAKGSGGMGRQPDRELPIFRPMPFPSPGASSVQIPLSRNAPGPVYSSDVPVQSTERAQPAPQVRHSPTLLTFQEKRHAVPKHRYWPIGIIANPASGKDIRRLVAYGSVFDNNEKVNIVRRVILGLDAMGVENLYLMPDYFGIGHRALADLDVRVRPTFLDMEIEGAQEDSTRAAAMMRDRDVGCIITLGGDGTNRAVAKGCGDTPILPISTGTNNVFPFMIEGTLAGMAAAHAARRSVRTEGFIHRSQRLEVRRNGRMADLALIDVVVSKPGFIATRAVWDVDMVQEIFLARAEPGTIGFSSIGGLLYRLAPEAQQGVHIRIGPGNGRVIAPIAPGLIRPVPISSHRLFEPGEVISICRTPAVVALDGERELTIKSGESVTVSISPDGPRVVDTVQALHRASEEGVFLEP